MAIFLNTKELPEDFFKEAKALRIEAKDRIQKCNNFLKNLEETSPTQAKELHLKVATVWREKSGSISIEENGELGKRLSHYHMDDPFVHATVLACMEGKEASAELLRASVNRIGKDRIEVKTKDPFETEYTIYLPENPTAEFCRDAARAAEVLSYAARKIPFQANYHRCSYEITEISEGQKNKLIKIEAGTRSTQIKSKIQASYEYLTFIDNALYNSFEKSLKKAKICKKSPFGNCHELASSGFGYFCDEKFYSNDNEIKIAKIGEGNHVFFTLGEVFADPWKRVLFPKSQVDERLYDYKGTDDFDRPLLERFNREKQSVMFITSNIYSVEDFKKYSSCPIPEIETLLAKFHSIPASDQEKKIAQAHEIIHFIMQSLDSQILKNSGLSSLFSQLHYLISDHPFDILDLPIFSDLKKAKEANDPKVFYQAMKKRPQCALGIINSGLWLAYRTGNFGFIQEAIRLGAEPNENTFFIAFLITQKTKNIDYLDSVIGIGAQATEEDAENLFLLAKQSGNLDLLRMIIEAGVEPGLSDIESLVNEAIITGNFDLLALFDPKKDTGLMIKHYLKSYIKEHPNSNYFQQFFSFAQRTGNINFLRIAIEAGVEPDESEVESLVKEAIRKMSLPSLKRQ